MGTSYFFYLFIYTGTIYNKTLSSIFSIWLIRLNTFFSIVENSIVSLKNILYPIKSILYFP